MNSNFIQLGTLDKWITSRNTFKTKAMDEIILKVLLLKLQCFSFLNFFVEKTKGSLKRNYLNWALKDDLMDVPVRYESQNKIANLQISSNNNMGQNKLSSQDKNILEAEICLLNTAAQMEMQWFLNMLLTITNPILY